MAHFDPTALCFLNRGDEIYIMRGQQSDRQRRTNSMSALLRRFRLFRAARLLSSDDAPDSFTAYYHYGGP